MKETKIKYSKDALKFLSRLDKKSVIRIKEAIRGLTLSPPVGDIKPMNGYDDGRKRLRIGAWRVIYRNESESIVEIIFVIDIGNRGDIYK
ncbi:MAG: type II toxin-antitoxin system RelE/ParE family toxin [Clostridia bacterium]|nr:type II toxin-antitoxin system RelE/ParE family toxin [Clostridia bacterium]